MYQLLSLAIAFYTPTAVGWRKVLRPHALKVEKLDPDKAFWFSAAQTLGDLRFQFKIDPTELGIEEFF